MNLNLGDMLTYAAQSASNVGMRAGKAVASSYAAALVPGRVAPFAGIAGDLAARAYDETSYIARTGRSHYFKTAEAERMTRPALLQTAKDLPIAALGGGMGYLAGRLVAEKYNVGGKIPLAAGSALGAYSSFKLQQALRERRQAANEA